MNAIQVSQQFLTRWRDDPDGAMMDLVSRDIVYTLNVEPEALVIGGEVTGWDDVDARMRAVRDVFEYLVYIPRILGSESDRVRAQIELIFKHRPSGELLIGSMRCVITVRNDKIARVDEYVDAPMIESFLRLFASGAPHGAGQ